MATPSQQSQQDIQNVNDQLNVLENTINNIGLRLGTQIKDKLSDLKDNTRAWVDEFSKGKDISNRLKNQLLTTQKDLNKLYLKQGDLQLLYNRAIAQGKTLVAARIQQSINQNKLSVKVLEDLQTQLVVLKKITENEKKSTEEQKKQKGIQGAIGSLKKQFGLDEIANMFTWAGLFKIILDGAFRFNSISVDIGKNLGYGANQADRVTKNLAHASNMSTNLNFTLKNAAEATSELNAATGGVAEYSANALETQIMLTKQFKLTGEEAAGLYKFSTLTGKESSQINKEMVAAFASTRNMVKGSADMKKTFADVLKVSGQLAINFKNNPVEITKAVVKAQALGTTLEKVRDQGKQLLNFETSIENELEAELITGKQLNLERARAAALMGDQEALMEELNAQGMSLEEFGSMNVIAQESFAKALGLSADELAEQLRKQEMAKKQGMSLAELTAKEAEEAQKRQDLQDKFNASIIKLQDGISNLVAGPLGQFLGMLSEALGFITYIVRGVQMIFDWTEKFLGKFGFIGNIIKGMTTSPTGLISGGSMATNEIKKAIFGTQEVKDGIAPPGGGPFTIVDRFGATAVTAAGDGIAVSPNISRGGGGGGGNSESMSAVVAAIRELQNSVNKLASRPITVNMDGEKVGTMVGRRNETGTEQVKNSYSLA